MMRKRGWTGSGLFGALMRDVAERIRVEHEPATEHIPGIREQLRKLQDKRDLLTRDLLTWSRMAEQDLVSECERMLTGIAIPLDVERRYVITGYNVVDTTAKIDAINHQISTIMSDLRSHVAKNLRSFQDIGELFANGADWIVTDFGVWFTQEAWTKHRALLEPFVAEGKPAKVPPPIRHEPVWQEIEGSNEKTLNPGCRFDVEFKDLLRAIECHRGVIEAPDGGAPMEVAFAASADELCKNMLVVPALPLGSEGSESVNLFGTPSLDGKDLDGDGG